MEINEGRIAQAARNTEVLRPPRQSLSTFGETNVYYYLVTEPAYADLLQGESETVIREGRVLAQRPRIVTPYYLSNVEGFSDDARKYFEMLIHDYGPNYPGLFYTYKNEPGELNIVSDNWIAVINRLNDELDRKNDPLTSIVKGEDDLWDVSLMKFIFELTRRSVADNIRQLGTKGWLDTDSRGVIADVRIRIEELFREAARGEIDPTELEKELERWDLFDEYQDRFFALFRRRR
jgi:hypothetical protein